MGRPLQTCADEEKNGYICNVSPETVLLVWNSRIVETRSEICEKEGKRGKNRERGTQDLLDWFSSQQLSWGRNYNSSSICRKYLPSLLFLSLCLSLSVSLSIFLTVNPQTKTMRTNQGKFWLVVNEFPSCVGWNWIPKETEWVQR